MRVCPTRSWLVFITVTVCAGNAEEVEEHLTLLESPDPGPWQNVEQLWKSTIVARLRYLYYEKGTLADYLNRFPILKSPSGYTLLLQDYKALYPEKDAGLCILTNSIKKIREVAAEKAAVTKDDIIKKAIQDYIDIIDGTFRKYIKKYIFF